MLVQSLCDILNMNKLQYLDIADADFDDPQKVQERQERVRAIRRKQEDDRRKKLEEILAAQRKALEKREQQTELRKKRLIEMRQRDSEHRQEVEQRRREKEIRDQERIRNILKKNSDRESKLNEIRDRRSQSAGYGFGSCTRRTVCATPIDQSHRAVSHGSLLRSPAGVPSPGSVGTDASGQTRAQRRAVSACSLNRRSVITGSHGYPGRTGSRHSDATLSSSESGSPIHNTRRQRPKSMAGLTSNYSPHTPSYASPTVSSAKRVGRNTDKKHTAGSMSPQSRSKSVESNLRNSSVDIKRSVDRLSQPRQPKTASQQQVTTPTRPKMLSTKPSPREPMQKQALTPVRNQPSASPNKKVPKIQIQSPRDKKSPMTKGPLKAVHNMKTETAKKSKPPSSTESTVAKDIPKKVSKSGSTTPREKKSPMKEPAGGPSLAPSSTPTEAGKKSISEEEYKEKLAEKRRQAREKAEREAEEEKQKQEEQRRLEEEKRMKEEEEQKRLEEEEMRLAAEAKLAEERRLEEAIKENEARLKAEQEKQEAERIAKEEADRKLAEELEKKEKERLEKARKEEEERIERKKRLEMIMKRVKPDTPEVSPSSESASTPSETPTRLSPEDQKPLPEATDNAPLSGTATPSNLVSTPATSNPSLSSSTGTEEKPKFKSAMLQQFMEKKRMKNSSSSEKLLDDAKSSEETISTTETADEGVLATSQNEEIKFDGTDSLKEIKNVDDETANTITQDKPTEEHLSADNDKVDDGSDHAGDDSNEEPILNNDDVQKQNDETHVKASSEISEESNGNLETSNDIVAETEPTNELAPETETANEVSEITTEDVKSMDESDGDKSTASDDKSRMDTHDDSITDNKFNADADGDKTEDESSPIEDEIPEQLDQNTEEESPRENGVEGDDCMGEKADKEPVEPSQGLSDIDSGVNSDGSTVADTEPSVNLIDVDNVQLNFEDNPEKQLTNPNELLLSNNPMDLHSVNGNDNNETAVVNQNGVNENTDVDMIDSNLLGDSMLSKKTVEEQLFQEEQLDVNLDTIQDSSDLMGLDNQQQKQCMHLDTADLINSNAETIDTSRMNNTTQENMQEIMSS